MIKILKLYSIPEMFQPIEFTDGINLILGEKVSKDKVKTKKDKKTNGVGKSMCIEFINFCLLKDEKWSRVMKIPFINFPDEVKIKLDIIIRGKKITIVRTKKEPNKPVIETEDEVVPFSKTEDALIYLTELFYGKEEDDLPRPSFRELIGPLIRDEDSEFKDIVECYDLAKRIPAVDLVGTHLYFFDINYKMIKEIKTLISRIESNTKTQTYLSNRLTDDGRKKISDIKAELNGVEREIEKAGISLDKFESEPIFQENKINLSQLDQEIEELRIRQQIIRAEIKRIDSMPKAEAIDISDIEIIYNKFKSGLGSVVSQSFKDVIEFKKKIEGYQSKLINEKAKTLATEESNILKRLIQLDISRGKILKGLDNKGILKDFKNSFSVYSKRKEDLSKNLSNLEEHELIQRKIKALKLEKDNLFAELDAQIFGIEKYISDFNKTLIEIHEYIMGNAEVSFEIKSVNTPKGKQIVKLDMRMDDDGSHSIDRTKVFIYDISLMLNSYTNVRHPLFLIHDNIFDVDQDTLIESLNYLAEKEIGGIDFQYILTLNRDKIENEERKNLIKLKIDEHIRARFTRQKRFLNFHYKEI